MFSQNNRVNTSSMSDFQNLKCKFHVNGERYLRSYPSKTEVIWLVTSSSLAKLCDAQYHSSDWIQSNSFQHISSGSWHNGWIASSQWNRTSARQWMRVSIICVVWNRSLDKCSPWALFRQLSSRSWATVTLFFGLALHHYIQRVQNAAAGFVLKVGPRDHITPALHQLHWLSDEFRIHFKLCHIMPQLHNSAHARLAWRNWCTMHSRSTCRPTQTAFLQDTEMRIAAAQSHVWSVSVFVHGACCLELSASVITDAG